MQMFEFGPRSRNLNRKGEEVETGQFHLHIQCRWRMVDPSRILFGSGDLNYSADENLSLDDFDWDKHKSVLDVRHRAWFAQQCGIPVHVVNVSGDIYGGFRIELESGFALETFPCDSDRGEDSEYWRLFGHRPDGSHFVVTGCGVEVDSVSC